MTAARHLDLDEWEEIVADYGVAYYGMPASQIMDNVRVDLTILDALMAASEESKRKHLLRVASRLSVIVDRIRELHTHPDSLPAQ